MFGAAMGGMGGGMNNNMGQGMMQMGMQGIQNTSRQEYNQRQALFQNMLGAMDDRVWLMQHFPNFWGWNSQGTGGGGYQAATNAPMQAVTSGNAQIPQDTTGYNNKSNAEAEYYRYLIEKDRANPQGNNYNLDALANEGAFKWQRNNVTGEYRKVPL